MKYLWLMMLALLSSCVSNEVLRVDSFHLKDIQVESYEAGMVRGEQRKRLHGAVSNQERQNRLGLYYTANWNDPALMQQAGILQFEYLQQITGASVQKMHHNIKVGESEGTIDFKIIGQAYQTKGRVLAWRLTYWRAGKLIASEQSYLWE